MFAIFQTKIVILIMTLWTLLRLVGALPVQDPAILGIYLGDDIQHPDWGGKKVYTSIGGGVRIRLKVKGFASDLRQEALQILLKDNSGATVHYKPYGRLWGFINRRGGFLVHCEHDLSLLHRSPSRHGPAHDSPLAPHLQLLLQH